MTKNEIISKYLSSDVPFTPEQRDAIDRKGDILVSASAGSGKTAVLVERILTRIIQGELSLDAMLAVTFTKAAAAQMKRKISDSLTAKLRKVSAALGGDIPSEDRNVLEDVRSTLSEQIRLVPAADITTIDSFCLKAVRSGFHALGIDPSFSMIDPVTGKLTAANTLEELFDTLYEEEDADFLKLERIFAPNYSEKALSEIILDLYDFSQSFPYPEKWLYECVHMYELPIKNTPWYKRAMGRIYSYAADVRGELEDMLRSFAKSSADAEEIIAVYRDDETLTGAYNGLWWKYLTDNYELFSSIATFEWDEIYDLLNTRGAFPNFTRAQKPYKQLKAASPELAAELDVMKDRADAVISAFKENIKKNWMSASMSESERVVKDAGETVRALVNVTVRFSRAFREKKLAMNVMDFSDCEHECLRLFEENEDIRVMYAEKYTEILIDEYQDTNNLQEAIFQKIAHGHGVGNTFMVGDMKQSIYRFRNSDPYIFRQKSELFSHDTSGCSSRILLSRNFRSRYQVLASINDIFNGVMNMRDGDLEYTDEQLRYDVASNNGYIDSNGTLCGGYRSELYAIPAPENGGEDGVTDALRAEARFAAAKIKQLIASGYKVQDKNGPRPIRASDIVILASSAKTIAEVYTEELKAAGIGAAAENEDFFERPEIMLILALLKIIENPRQDIPFIAVMLSPAGGFSEDDLVSLRIMGDGDIYSLMKERAAESDDLAMRCAAFLRRVAVYRRESKLLSIERFLWYLYEDTKLYDFYGAADPTGEAQSNLRLLFDRAKAFVGDGFRSLFDFTRYIERVQNDGVKINGASSQSASDAVRLMTIHKSKGLEFPVVILASAGKEFAGQELKGQVLFHKDLGIGADSYDTESFYKQTSLAKNAVRDVLRAEMLAEEMRKLYVALTRAQEKLIVLCGGKSLEVLTQTEEGYIIKGGARGFFSWLLPRAMNSSEWDVYEITDNSRTEAPSDAEEESGGYALDELKKSVGDILSFEYKYDKCRSVPSKVSVTSLKEKQAALDEDAVCIASDGETTEEQGDSIRSAAAGLARLPEFLKNERSVTGAHLGTVYHKILENSDIKTCFLAEDAEKVIADMLSQSLLTPEEAAAADTEKIAEFYSSEIAERMRKSKRLMREVPFEISIPVSAYDKTLAGQDRTMLLQGIIDCCFEEDGGMVLLDYKSDYYSGEDARRKLEKKYAVQLDWYSRAIEKILDKKVIGTYIYFLYRNELIRIDAED